MAAGLFRRRHALARLQAEVPGGSFVVAIDSDTTSAFNAVSLIVAQSVEVREGRWDHRSGG